jgi:hypothetical protein
MKRFLLSLVIVACGSSTTTGSDGGGDDSGSDAVSDASSNNDGATDGASDAPTDGAQNDGAQAGMGCDPTNNQCGNGLLCCSEPTHMADAATAYFCEKPVNNGCPLLP